MARGRPLWFVGSVVAGWTGLRVVALLPAGVPTPALLVTPISAAAATTLRARAIGPLSKPRPAGLPTVVKTAAHRIAEPTPLAAEHVRAFETAIVVSIVTAGAQPAAAATPSSPPLPAMGAGSDAVAATPAVPRSGGPRLAMDAWLVARPGGGDNLAFGQLGGSQGGVRATYVLDRRVALSGRLSAPVRGDGAEAGVGIDLRPTPLPVHLLVEERFELDGRGARPAVLLIGGASTMLPERLRLDAYAQGGAVWRRGKFVDGAAVLSRSIIQRGNTRLELGGGVWGAAQRRVARLDVGPSIALAAPAGGTALRLQFDYRARVAGRARPGSGPALTLGGSF